jgi:3-hydroxyisobutyrate dehydrogenase-like beta-hydroxyacid dehydrogenase
MELLRKDLELGLESGRELDVPLPLTALTHEIVVEGISLGLSERDFASLLAKLAQASGRELEPEDIEVGDGLG